MKNVLKTYVILLGGSETWTVIAYERKIIEVFDM